MGLETGIRKTIWIRKLGLEGEGERRGKDRRASRVAGRSKTRSTGVLRETSPRKACRSGEGEKNKKRGSHCSPSRNFVQCPTTGVSVNHSVSRPSNSSARMVLDPVMTALRFSVSAMAIPPDGRPSGEGYINPLLFLPGLLLFFFLFYLFVSQSLLLYSGLPLLFILPAGLRYTYHLSYTSRPIYLSLSSFTSSWLLLSVTNPRPCPSMCPRRLRLRPVSIPLVVCRGLRQRSPTAARQRAAGPPRASATTPEASPATMSPAPGRIRESTLSMF